MQTSLRLAFAAAAITAISACGGGGGDDNSAAAPPPPPAPPAPVTVSGKLVSNQGIQGATVCLDLNANGACDSGEPASAVTGTDGSYTLSTDPATTTAAQAAAAPLVASIPATAVDAATPAAPLASRPLVFSAPAGKTGQINPLTTLVQAGVASGLSVSASEAAVAVQLAIPVADIYDYQGQAAPVAPYPDNARTMALRVLQTLDDGQPLAVVDLAASTANTVSLATLNYTDANNYYYRTLEGATLPGTGTNQVQDKRAGRTNGVATTDAFLYQAAYLGPSGWVHCDATGFVNTRGTPSRSGFCSNGQVAVAYNSSTDISGKTMGEVIRGMQAATDGSNTITMNAALVDNQVFPAGSQLVVRKNLLLGQDLFVNNLNSSNEYLTNASAASIETFIKARPVTNVNLTPNAIAGISFVGFTGDTSRWLGMAFVDETSKVQYYDCVPTANGAAFASCTTSAQGTFEIVTQNGKRLIKYAGQPAPVDSINYTIGHGEYSPGVMVRFRETKPDARYKYTVSTRLNGTAWDALKTALNL